MIKVVRLAALEVVSGPLVSGEARQACAVWQCESLFICPHLGYPSQDFDWADYLKQCGAEAAPQRCFPPVRTPTTSWLLCRAAGTAALPLLSVVITLKIIISLNPDEHSGDCNHMV